MKRLFGYALASLGPVAGAGAQFLLSLLLLRAMTPAAFGSFSFLLVLVALGTSVWSALFGAPLAVCMAQRSPAGEGQVAAILGTCVWSSLAAVAVFAATGRMLGLTSVEIAAFALFAPAALARSVARLHGYASGSQWRTVRSDLVYAGVLLAATLALILLGTASVATAFAALLAANLLGLGLAGRAFAAAARRSATPGAVRGYRAVWRSYSGWSLAGVISTEATVNCHAYLVTGWAGPAAFAPIAATQLFIRPIAIAANALLEYERAQMARLIGTGRIDEAVRSKRLCRAVLIAGCLGVAVLAGLLLHHAPRLIFPPEYPLSVLAICTGCWLVVALVRYGRVPESALLQAAGEFGSLAMASIYAAGFSIAGVAAILLLLRSPEWSVAGVLTGEIAFLLWVMHAAARWQGRQGAGGPAGMPAPVPAEVRP